MTNYIRYRTGSTSSYGILDGETVREIEGDLFGSHSETGATHKLPDVKLLHPCQPTKILCVGLNYKSHLGGRPQPSRPEIFYKPLSALQDPGRPDRDSARRHRSALRRRIGGGDGQAGEKRHGGRGARRHLRRHLRQRCQRAQLAARRRARICNGGAPRARIRLRPFGPAIVTGIDYCNLLLTTRLNGEVVQQQYTSDLIFDCPAIVSWISGWVTLMPGDVIYTGTPGSTRKMSPGDVVQVEIQDIGVLENPVV